MSAANRPPSSDRDFQEALDRIAALERAIANILPVSSSSLAVSGKPYIDSSDGKMYFKDAAGAPHVLY